MPAAGGEKPQPSKQETLDEDEEITQPVILHQEIPHALPPVSSQSSADKREVQRLLSSARWKSTLQVIRFLVSKALLIFATIFIGIFITIIIANRPINTGYGVKPPPLELSIMQQVDLMIRVYTYNDPAYQEMSQEQQQKVVSVMQDLYYEDLGLKLPYFQRNLRWTLNALRFDWGALERIATSSGKGFSYRPQTGHDLGMRMVNAFKSCFDDGFRSVIIIGSDCPDLPQWIIEEAFEALQRHGAVIGPSYDGGYYLIGFSGESFSGNYFENIPWSTENVYKETVGRFDKEGVSFHVLPAWRDIDTIDDVRALLKECGHSDFRKSKTMRFLRLNGFAVSG